MFVRGIIIEHRMDRLPGRDLALDSIEKTDELEMPVVLHAAPDHRSVQHAEGSEQGSGAMALVIVCHGLTAPGLDRQSSLGAVERLDLAFLVEREHQGMRRRIEIEADDVGELGLKAGIARPLEGSAAGAAAVCAPARCAAPSLPTAP